MTFKTSMKTKLIFNKRNKKHTDVQIDDILSEYEEDYDTDPETYRLYLIYKSGYATS